MARKFKDFLLTETKRNADAHRVIMRFMERALGTKPQMLIAHHLVYMVDGEPPIEIPSMDTLIFSHDLMFAVFGDQAKMIMSTLSQRDVDTRDIVLNDFLDMIDAADAEVARATTAAGSVTA